MLTAGLTAGLLSFGKSIYDFQTWDRLSIDDKMAKVQNKFGADFSYNSDLKQHGTFNLETSEMTLGTNALTSKSNAYLTARHELKHLKDWPLYKNGLVTANQLEIRAHKHELLSFRASSVDYRNGHNTMRIRYKHRGFGVFNFNPFIYFNSIF
jgi:predicted SprT family Zn-dependent metalloprotease